MLHATQSALHKTSRTQFSLKLLSDLPGDAVRQFLVLVKEHVIESSSTVFLDTVSFTVVQSGYILGGFLPCLNDCINTSTGYVLQCKRSFHQTRQRVFGISWSRQKQIKKQSFVVVRGEDDHNPDLLWVGQVLLLVHIKHGTEDLGQFAYIQYMEVTTPLSTIDESLGCVCLRWATADDIDYTTNYNRTVDVDRIDTAEWYGLVPFTSLLGTVQVIRSNIPINPFTMAVPWPMHRLHMNRFDRHDTSY